MTPTPSRARRLRFSARPRLRPIGIGPKRTKLGPTYSGFRSSGPFSFFRFIAEQTSPCRSSRRCRPRRLDFVPGDQQSLRRHCRGCAGGCGFSARFAAGQELCEARQAFHRQRRFGGECSWCIAAGINSQGHRSGCDDPCWFGRSTVKWFALVPGGPETLIAIIRNVERGCRGRSANSATYLPGTSAFDILAILYAVN